MAASAASIRLFCLPYAGGGSAPFYRLSPWLPGWLELVPLNLPGRESRINHPPYQDLKQLAAAAAAALCPFSETPYAVLGHSLGAMVAYELVHQLGELGCPRPRLLALAACRAPQRQGGEAPIHELPDEKFLEALAGRYDGIPAAVHENAELLELMLPTMRADVQMLETYQAPNRRPLEVELMALGGSHDRAVSAADLHAWRQQTTGRFSARILPGGHFFLFESTTGLPAAWDVLVNRLRAVSG